ncbi:MAG: agmatine deiminase, partial [Acidiferrobacterales bacterium]|nr:agmatine deiminase [Acidiferrobacterales bacterium]
MNITDQQSDTPRSLGFRMPGEHEPHAGCWMIFPERADVWGIDPRPAQQVFANVANAVSQFEPVTMCVSKRSLPAARALLPNAVRMVEMATNDAWMRDCGPTFLVDDNGGTAGVDWEFNAWGGLNEGLYLPWDDDNRVAQYVLNLVGARRFKTSLVNEGGAIHVDGEGTLITTRSVLLNENRNPGLTQEEVERVFHDYLGIDKTIWLEGEAYDETDGHVDGLCAYIRPGVVMIAWHNDPQSEEYAEYQSIYDQLTAVTDARGRKLEIIKLPVVDLPPMTAEESQQVQKVVGTFPRKEGDYVWGGYINFYIANGGVVFPCFDVPEDAKAKSILRKAFPDRKVVG